jgi:glutamyl-tRNA reductase
VHIAVVGLNHRSSPVEVRERLAVPQRSLPEALARMASHPDVLECAIVSTCNRTEAYAALFTPASDAVASELAALGDLQPSALDGHLYTHCDDIAVRHLFRVASGVDSMVLGEDQILGQVRQAYESAHDAGATGPLLNRLFETALATGKRVRTETGINRGAFSVGSAAVELAKSIFGDLAGRRVLLLGAGKMSEATAERLMQSGATSVIVANRTYDRAVQLADAFGGRAVRYEQFEDEMAQADIVIASTASPHYIVRREPFQQVMRLRKMRPIFLIDIAVPRNIDPAIAHLDCAFLYDIDDLNDIVARTSGERHAQVEHAEAIIDQQVAEFVKWRGSLLAVPVIRGLRGRLQRLADEEMERFGGRLSQLSGEDREVVQQLVRSLVNKISHHPITHIKDYAAGDGVERLQTAVELFGIDHENRDDLAADCDVSSGEGI